MTTEAKGCAVCGRPGARPLDGHRMPLCAECDAAWIASAERARAATARADFIDRRRREIGATR